MCTSISTSNEKIIKETEEVQNVHKTKTNLRKEKFERKMNKKQLQINIPKHN